MPGTPRSSSALRGSRGQRGHGDAHARRCGTEGAMVGDVQWTPPHGQGNVALGVLAAPDLCVSTSPLGRSRPALRDQGACANPPSPPPLPSEPQK